MRGSGVNYMGQGQQQAAAQQQPQPQQPQQPQPQMQKQQKDNVAPPGSEQTHWFQGNQNNAGNKTSNYSSYANYDHALDSRTIQKDNASHQRGGKAN
jgi:hypothetical protein